MHDFHRKSHDDHPCCEMLRQLKEELGNFLRIYADAAREGGIAREMYFEVKSIDTKLG